jgi:hypothetical protein
VAWINSSSSEISTISGFSAVLEVGATLDVSCGSVLIFGEPSSEPGGSAIAGSWSVLVLVWYGGCNWYGR